MSLLHDHLRRTASAMPQRIAITCDARSLTFAQLDRDSDKLACELRALGVRRGDRVAIMLENRPELIISVYGALKAGAAFVLIAPGTRGEKLRFLLCDCEPKALVTQNSTAPTVKEAVVDAALVPAIVWCGDNAPSQPGLAAVQRSMLEVRQASPRTPVDLRLSVDDLAAIIYTSGSTGEPKGVMLAHRNLVNTTQVIAEYLGNTPDDVVCCALPLSFSYGLCQALVGASVGYTLVLEQSFAFPVDMLRRMRERGVTGLPAVPTMMARLLPALASNPQACPTLRYITNAAAPLPPAHVEQLHAILPKVRLFSMYGQTECTRVAFLDPSRTAAKPDSVGRPIARCETLIIDERGESVPPGETGELIVRGPNVMRGYWRRPEETAAKLRDRCGGGGKWLHTGDLFRMDPDGDLFFVARQDDIFKCRGEKVSPREIENILCQIPAVREAVVVGVPDAVDGTSIKAVLVLRDGAMLSEQQVRRHCAAFLEAALMPRHIEFRMALPTTASGKVRRRDVA